MVRFGDRPAIERGGVSVRAPTVVRWKFGVGLALCLIAALAATGCGSSNSSTTGTTPATGGNEAETGTEGGTNATVADDAPAEATGPLSSATWDLPYGEPPSLDPIFAFGYSSNTVLANVCESLLKLSPERKIEPALAESVEHPDPLTWVYDIRKGVKFFDGTPLTAADVVYNIKRNTNESLGSYYYTTYGVEISSVSQTGPNQVTVKTKKPNTLVNEMMVTGLGSVVDPKSIKSQGKDFGTAGSTLNCSGAYELENWTSGSSLTLKANPNYWDKSLTPKTETVKFDFVTDPTALANALVSGEIDGTFEAPVSATETLKSSGNGHLYLGTSTQMINMYPFGKAVENVKIREAISASVDRAGIAETAFAGTATPAKSLAVPDASSFGEPIFKKYYESLPEPGPDLVKAKKLVEEAGSPTEPIRTVVPAGEPAIDQAANAIQNAASEAGLNIEIVTLPINQYTEVYKNAETARQNYDMIISSNYYNLPDLLSFYTLTVLPGTYANISEYENPVVTNAVAAGVATENDNERATDTVEASEQIDKDLVYIPMLRLSQRLYMNDRVTGPQPTFPYMYYPWAALIGSAG
jgi:peptide/nickel transport system substrate-binding protein